MEATRKTSPYHGLGEGTFKSFLLRLAKTAFKSHGSTQLELFKSCLLRLPTAALGYDKISIIGAQHAKF